jgi:hypothetical protein
MARTSDRRDLSLVRESAATTRVLDLAFIETRFGETEDYLQKPLFRGRKLNTSIIMKHALRLNERRLFTDLRVTATKIVFPFSNSELRLGGAGLFVGEIAFERTLRSSLSYKDIGDFERDLEVLMLIDALPSFDPFLMRERLRLGGLDPARCYFDVSDADASRMQAFVSSQIAALVELAFAGGAAAPRELSVRLAEKLMTDETAQSLEPLRATLRLSGDEYREGVFAWKGFLYYKWMVGELSARLADLARSILSARVLNASHDDMAMLATCRQKIVRILGIASSRINEALGAYDAAFADLSAGRPMAFRDFLLSAPKMFLVIGEAVGILKHIDSFWRFRFPAGRRQTMDAEEAMEVFGEFEITLGGIDAAHNESAARSGGA